jgi:hypothetical protein
LTTAFRQVLTETINFKVAKALDIEVAADLLPLNAPVYAESTSTAAAIIRRHDLKAALTRTRRNRRILLCFDGARQCAKTYRMKSLDFT